MGDRSSLEDSPEGGDNSKSPLLAVETFGPVLGQLVLEARELQVTADEAELVPAGVGLLDMRIGNVADAADERLDGSINGGGGAYIFIPERLEPVFVEKRCRQIRLGIEVAGQDAHAQVGIHPGEMVNQGGLANPSLVVEESDHRRPHGRFLTRARMCVSST